VCREIDAINRGFIITSDGGLFYNEPTTTVITSPSSSSTSAPVTNNKRYIFRFVAQCFGIPEAVQRPLISKQLSIMQFNIADGSTGTRGDWMLKWLQSKAEAGVMFIGFCELVGWQTLYSGTDLIRNVPQLSLRSANSGYIYSHITQSTAQSTYPVGIVSLYPFIVRKEYYFPFFQRVVLHVYFEKFELNVLVCHLHAHSAEERTKETNYIATSIIQPLLKENKDSKIIVMGDLNTLSPLDKK
jgi:hypothetical protein